MRYFADTGRWKVSLHTTVNYHNLPSFSHPEVSIWRHDAAVRKTVANRLLAHWRFSLLTTWQLLVGKADVVLYMEPQSSFPVFLLSLCRRFPLFIHHHEYHDPVQYLRPGMRVARLFHWLETLRLFQRANWISHTNQRRLDLFLGDHRHVDPAVGRILENLPPASWSESTNIAWADGRQSPLRLVYVGSLSREDTYIEQLLAWLRKQPVGSVRLDIFAYNVHDDTRRFLTANASTSVRFFPKGVIYDDLPRLLRRYHTGVILYKALTTNYRHNATNKLFEYLACGLDVVFPSVMEGVKPYRRSDRYPRVVEVDFETGAGLCLPVLADRGRLPEATLPMDCGTAARGLEGAMLRRVSSSQPTPEM